jgi:cell wall-associated NlpC family hydrolase
VNAVRGDIADIALAGTLFAPHYARPVILRCVDPSVLLRSAPTESSEAVSQLLAGEGFAMLDASGGWAWGYCLHDHYVGYVPAAAIGAATPPTHRVVHISTFVRAEPDPQSATLRRLTIGAGVTTSGSDDWVRVDDGYLFAAHLAPIETALLDPAGIAERMVGEPYLWGGRGDGGVDCSGLVQIAFGLAGHALPRDSDQQREVAGIAIADNAALRRGDLVFFPGHVGIMADAENIIHATAWSMSVIVEPLAALISRTAAEHDFPVLARRRIV